jgi:cob(I)alamin adenosyltransferase
MKVYTKTGDKGETALLSGKRVLKTHPRIAVYGELDSLNSSIGMILSLLDAHKINKEESAQLAQIEILQSCQNEIFNLGSHLSCDKNSFLSKLAALNQKIVLDLEKQIDLMDEALPELKNFILPGGHLSAAQAHVSRTLTRTCERNVIHLQQMAKSDETLEIQEDLFLHAIIFLNRFSDYLFTLSRFLNHISDSQETPWHS